MALEDSISEEHPINIDSFSTEHGKERNQKLKRNVLASLLLRSASILVPLFIVPFLLRYLGKESYGVYELLSGVALLLGLGNLGLSYGLMNFLTVCYAERDYEKARQLISTFLVASIALLGILATLAFAAAFTLPWSKLLKVSVGAGGQNLQWAVCVAIVCTLLMVFCGIMDAVYGAFQNTAAVSAWDAGSKAAATISIVTVTYTHLGLMGAIFAGVGVPAMIKLAGVLDLFRNRLPEVRPHLRFYRAELLRSLLADGGLLLILTLAFGGIFQIDKIFLGFIIGSKAVAEFSILGRIFLLVSGIYGLMFCSLWPAYGEALHRRDFVWIRKWLSLTLVVGLAIFPSLGAALCLFGRPLYHLWLGSNAVSPSYSVILSFVACFSMSVWMTAHGALLNAARVLKPQIIVLASHTILTMALMPMLIIRWRISGAACAPFVAGLLTSAWGYPWLVRKYVLSAK